LIEAPRQSGKTTFLRAFAKQLIAEGLFTALYTTCEIAEAHGDDFVGAQSALVQRLIVDIENQLQLSCAHPVHCVGRRDAVE